MKKLIFLILFCIVQNSMLWGEEIMHFKTLSASFTQTVVDKTTHTYHGTLLIQKPFKALWHYSKPVVRDIYIDKGSMVTYEPRLSQATITPLKGSMNLLALLKIATKVKDGVYRASYEKKDIFITTQEGLIDTIQYVDPLGGNVTLKFDDVHLNGSINEQSLTFNPPKGTTISHLQ